MYIFIAIVCYFFAGIVHELGHILVGLIHGWRFCWLVIGPFGIKLDPSGRLQFYLEKQLALWGGVSCTIPRCMQEENVKVWSKVLLAGPIASIITGMIFLPVGMITKNLALLLLGAMPLGMGLVSILPLPLKTGMFYTDGGRWSRLNHGGQKAEEEVALFKLAEKEATGVDFSTAGIANQPKTD